MPPDGLKLCFLIPKYALVPPFGGIATYTRDAARWLVAHGHEVHVVSVSRSGPPGTVDDEGVAVHMVPPRRIRPRQVLRYAARLPGLASLGEAYAGWNLLEDSVGAWQAVGRLSSPRPFDVIEAADWSGLGFWGAANRFRRIPILVRSHGYANTSLPGWAWPGIRFQLALERSAVRRADFVLAASVERVAHYRSAFGVQSSRIGALPYGIDVGRFPEPALTETSSGAAPTILYLGSIERRKGCDLLFDALRLVHRRTPHARAVFVGAVADMKDEFEAFLRETEGWVDYAGAVPQDEVAGYLGRSDMIVLPSRFETLPRVLIEALAAGVPQIASPANGIPEIVEDGVTGFLVDPLTPGRLADAICRLCASPQLRAAMARRSRARALVRFDMSRVMPVQVEVYRALREGRSPVAVLAAPA